MARSNVCVVWDYDHSLIPDNSDTFIPKMLAPGRALDALFANPRALPWTELIGQVLSHLHSVGVTAAQIAAASAAMPFDAEVHTAIAELAARGARQSILSDANTLYISTFLARHGLTAHFADVHTNPATVAADGGLVRLAPAVPPGAPHGCALCPPNLCKGAVLRRWRAAAAPAAAWLYVGDGGGDVCACLQLGAGDVVFARAGFPLAKALQGRHAAGLRAALRLWASGGELRAGLAAAAVEAEAAAAAAAVGVGAEPQN
jgi:pyridoxal phosphate phosphatase PHOSPHO2